MYEYVRKRSDGTTKAKTTKHGWRTAHILCSRHGYGIFSAFSAVQRKSEMLNIVNIKEFQIFYVT